MCSMASTPADDGRRTAAGGGRADTPAGGGQADTPAGAMRGTSAAFFQVIHWGISNIFL